jgi:hypothetical protein
MTGMPTAPLTDDLLSYARLDGDALRVVLVLTEGAEVNGPQVFVRFQDGEERHRFRASLEQAAGRARVEVMVPRQELAVGVWHLRLRDGRGGTVHDLGARVLLHGDQPVALLFGKTANIT